MFYILSLGVAGELNFCVVHVGFSHSADGGCRGTLSLFELVSSSCSVSSRSSLFPLMLSPSSSSVRVKSRYTSATSPSGVLTLFSVSVASGRASGSWFRSCFAMVAACAALSVVVFVTAAFSPASRRISGSSEAGGSGAGRGHVPVVPCGRIGVFRRY